MKYSYLFVLVGALTVAACNQGPEDEFGREVTDPRIDTTDRTQTSPGTQTPVYQTPGSQTQSTQTQSTQPSTQPQSQQPPQQQPSQQPGGFGQPRDADQTGTTSTTPNSGVDPIDRTGSSSQQTQPQRDTLPPQ